jgi:hypothetical protein
LREDFLNIKKGEVLWHDTLNYTCHPVDENGQEDVNRRFPIANLQSIIVERIALPDNKHYENDKFIVYDLIEQSK